METSIQSPTQPSVLRNYYRWQSRIYDRTRWSFLFGRNELLNRLPLPADSDAVLLEVGCGTGRNLRRLAQKYPQLRLTGLDLSPDMLALAAKAVANFPDRVELLEHPYGISVTALPQKPDLVLFSYALTMFNPGWEAAIWQAYRDLPAGGHIAVVDFHRSRSRWFRWWMGQNHVRMEGHLLPLLEETFETHYVSRRKAYLGLWHYVLFVGKKR